MLGYHPPGADTPQEQAPLDQTPLPRAVHAGRYGISLFVLYQNEKLNNHAPEIHTMKSVLQMTLTVTTRGKRIKDDLKAMTAT